jgi:hypothetical protein
VQRLKGVEAWWRGRFDLPFVGIALDRPSKILALNSTIPALDAIGAGVVAWFDDDIRVDAGCLAALLRAYDEGHPGIYGARKTAVADRTAFSRRWAEWKNTIEPVNAYPHGCAVMMARRELHDGVPVEYQSDDVYYLLRYLEPGAEDPFWRLVVIPEALVLVPSTNDRGTTARRIARNFRNGMRILADAPAESVRAFLSSVLFRELRRPRGLSEVASLSYWSNGGWQTLKLAFWSGLALSVLARGIVGRPLSPTWYSAPFPDAHRPAEPSPR